MGFELPTENLGSTCSAIRTAAGNPQRLALAALLALVLAAACTRSSDEADPAWTDRSTLRVGLAQRPLTLDPRLAADAASMRIGRLLYARLTELDAQGEPRPGVADWRVIDPLHHRFTLRPDRLPFADGRPLTARDVQATYAFVLDPARASPLRGPLATIRRLEVVDDSTLDLHLARPDRLFPAYLSLGIVPADGFDASRPTGSGPLRYRAGAPGDRLLLERRQDGQRIALITVPDPTVRALKLVRGELDIAPGDLPPELQGWLAGQPQIRLLRTPGGNLSYLGFNLDDPVLRRHAVRQAIAHALDRAAIIRYLLRGAARPAAGLFAPEHWAGAAQQAPALRHDPVRARALLAAAGLAAVEPIRLRYQTSTDPLRLRIAAVLQRQLAQVGIEARIDSRDFGSLFAAIQAGRFQLYGLSWVGLKTPDIFRHALHSTAVPPAGANRGRYRDTVADRLIEAAERAPERNEQAALYAELNQRLLTTLPFIPLWYEDQVAAVRADIEGFTPAADGSLDALLHTRRSDSPQ